MRTGPTLDVIPTEHQGTRGTPREEQATCQTTISARCLGACSQAGESLSEPVPTSEAAKSHLESSAPSAVKDEIPGVVLADPPCCLIQSVGPRVKPFLSMISPRLWL